MGRWRSCLLVVCIAVALCSLSACGRDTSPEVAPDASPERKPPIRKGDQYVAIGDSYTSGPRNGPSSAKDGCLQTTANYPHLLAKRLGLKLTDVSCGGAKTKHVTEPQQLGLVSRPPQADALSPKTDLVTISLAANDFGAFGTVVWVCTRMRAKDPTGAPCTAANEALGQRSIVHRMPEIEKRLVEVITLVKDLSPKARIVFVGYPEFFPAAGPCEQLPLAEGDFPFAHRINELLVQAQKDAAKQAKVDYIDVFTATKGHNMCADEPLVAGLRPTRIDAMYYHSYPEEQRLVSDLLVDLLD